MNKLSEHTVFGVVGGDLRQAALANFLLRQGYEVHAFFLDQQPLLDRQYISSDPAGLGCCDVVIFPLPVSDEKGALNAPLYSGSIPLSDCLNCCRSDAFLLGGKISDRDRLTAQEAGHRMSDYLTREEMAVLNAVPTAEGAVGIALSERASTLWESRCLITGFGRCGKALALLLKGFGAHVTVAARSAGELAFARTLGLNTISLSKVDTVLPEQEIIFNTIPSPVLGEKSLQLVAEDCLLIDLASRPGGIDFAAAGQLGRKTIWALSLPGKVSPITAGNIICDTVINMITERGDLIENN